MKEEDLPMEPGAALGVGMGVGLGVGVAVGAAFDNVFLGLPIGIAVGLGLAKVFSSGGREKRLGRRKRGDR